MPPDDTYSPPRRPHRSPFSSSPPAQPQATLPPYRSDLPDYLIGIVHWLHMQIDAITKADELHALRHDFLHYSLEELVAAQDEPRELIWLFADPHGQRHLLSHNPHPLLAPRTPLGQFNRPPTSAGEVKLEEGAEVCVNLLANQLQAGVIEDIRGSKIRSIDQIRLKCEANLYTSPLDLDRDLRRLIAYHQVFRAGSIRSFEYLTMVYEKIIFILIKRDFFRRFFEIKQSDLARLVKYETQFKTNPTKWPFVPSSFREYEEIDRYVPTPPQRIPIINNRLQSQKDPVDCPETCVCLLDPLPQGVTFCKYSLLNGWETDCPNRAKKIQCAHTDPEKARRCRNGQIRKHQRKLCAGKAKDDGERPPQIEERLTWGIDLFTRNVIYHCLPEIDIEGVKKVNNQARRNHFIENSLGRALNFMGAEGYNLYETCKYIMHAEIPASSPLKEELKEEEGDKDLPPKPLKLFTQRDYLYADLLARNYQLSEDKTGFRVHTKGKGAICIDQGGIQQGSFIVEYFGEIYEPWRWYDREDFIKQVLKKKKLKNYIPQFYNIYLEKHADQPLGYDILVVDPSKMGNFSSRFSHSCEPNCGTVTTVSQGRYYIGMYAFRPISYGEQLTFDYCSMTESNFQHLNSICLCGRQKCRGNYLQLSNNKVFNNLMDNSNCFFTRNSAILKATGSLTVTDVQRCEKHNIKQGFMQDMPLWIMKWLPGVLDFIIEESEIYKQSLLETWRKAYPWDTTEPEEEKQRKMQLYSDANKHDLQMLRFQNLITSVDKLKYFYSKNENNKQPPIGIEKTPKIIDVLIGKDDSVLLQLQESLIKYKCEALAKTMEHFVTKINKCHSGDEKLFYFRLCFLVVSHKLLFLTGAAFNHELLSDITYFYAFTHTYFSPTDFKSFEADEIVIGLSDILGDKGAPNERKERSKKKYSGPFVWGQIVSWYKQTIVCPQASLSQDRRGTLSFPLIKSIMRSEYPYEKQSRIHFHKTLLDKPANSWPPAPGCDLSFKNPYKLYGTMLFESVHSRDQLRGRLPKESLLESCLALANFSFRQKLELFKSVEAALSRTPTDSLRYNILKDKEIQMDFDANVPLTVRNSNFTSVGDPRKRVKNEDPDEV